MTPRAGRGWWVGATLALAGLAVSAPRAAADCTTHLPSLSGASLPFDSGAWGGTRRTESRMAHSPCPCRGPHCRSLPADPAPPPPAPPRSAPGQDWAWLQTPPAPCLAAGAAWAGEGDPLTPLFSPSPLERPPR